MCLLFGAVFTVFYLQKGLYEINSHTDDSHSFEDDYNDTNINITQDNYTFDQLQGQHYPLCDMSFQDIEQEAFLSVVDICIMNLMVYDQDNYDLNQMVNKYFNNQYQMVARRDISPFFFHIRHKYYKIDYIIIGKKSSISEYLPDGSLFIQASLYQILSLIIPFLNAIPTSFISKIVYWASSAEVIMNRGTRSQFSDVIYNYAYDYLNSLNDSTSLYIGGYSLAGTVSSVVAAKLYQSGDFDDSYINSFGLNSPGVLYSSEKFGIQENSLLATSTNVVSKRDIVSMIDVHSGILQQVYCEQDYFYQCHKLRNIVCQISTNCPSNAAENFTVIDKWCNEPDVWHGHLGAILDVQNVTISNFTITYNKPVQYLFD